MAIFKKKHKGLHEILFIIFIIPLVFVLTKLVGKRETCTYHFEASWGTKLMAAESFLAILYLAAVNNDANYE